MGRINLLLAVSKTAHKMIPLETKTCLGPEVEAKRYPHSDQAI